MKLRIIDYFAITLAIYFCCLYIHTFDFFYRKLNEYDTIQQNFFQPCVDTKNKSWSEEQHSKTDPTPPGQPHVR